MLRVVVIRSQDTSLVARSTACAGLGLQIADLELRLDTRESSLLLRVPACHARFMAPGTLGGGLTLQIRDGPIRNTDGWQSLFYAAETWQLWLDGMGRYVFGTSRHSPPLRQIAIDPAFGAGEVIGAFSAAMPAGQAVYPLQDIDTVIFANWLAGFGDLIVHASGIDDAGAGYAFVGPSGAGKSTLAAGLAPGAGVTVLGEDQVILRYVAGRFLIYGTPWHTNPAFCAYGGVPLRKLFFLDRSLEEGVRPCRTGTGIARLMQDAFIPYYNRAGVARILETLSRLVQQVPFYTLSYRLGADVLALIRDA